MSRFSKAEAEAKGWVFVHDREGYDVTTSGTQGEKRSTPASVRAEKYVTQHGRVATLINEEAETIGKLLERIHAYESFQDKVGTEQQEQPAPIVDPIPVNESGIPQRTVLVVGEDGQKRSITDAEFSARERQDALLTKDGMVFLVGANEDSLPGATEPEVEPEVEEKPKKKGKGK